MRLPGRRDLLRAGRGDLVSAIARAGGFAAVAAQLRLRGVRKPPGYWGDPAILEQCAPPRAHAAARVCRAPEPRRARARRELREFVASHWSEHRDADAGNVPYYYNDISGEVLWDAPRCLRAARRRERALAAGGGGGGSGSSSSGEDTDDDAEAEDAPRVMPPQRALVAAGRWDLVQAVVAYGGSRAVAEELGWTAAPRWAGRHLASPDALEDELRRFCADAGEVGMMPTFAALRDAGRDDLASAVSRHGGAAAVAARLSLQLRRSPRGRWVAPAAGMLELRAFLRKRAPERAAKRTLPTRTELQVCTRRACAVACLLACTAGADAHAASGTTQAAGRPDLIYVLSRHGRAPLAKALRLAPQRRRGVKRPFAAAREFARALRLRSQAEWREYCRSGARPDDVPADPYHAYVDEGWQGWPDFLGSRARIPAGAVLPVDTPPRARVPQLDAFALARTSRAGAPSA
jgi:hypothetical protein